MKVYYNKDSDLSIIREKNVSIIGYGSQAHAHALNLKDSGVKNITIILKQGSKSIEKAKNDGFEVVEIDKSKNTIRNTDVTVILTPDEIQSQIYTDYLKDNLKADSTIMFAHGLNIHFKLISPRKDLNVVMVAPKGPGHTVRAEYKKEGGVPCLIAIDQDNNKKAFDIALSYACAIGGGRSGIIHTTFKEECETDLFGEQAVLCGGVTSLIKNGFETLLEAGYSPEMAYFECLHEMKLIVDLLYEGGISNMRHSISNTAEYGDFISGPVVVDKNVKKRMKDVLKKIQSGEFVNNFITEYKNGNKKFNKMRHDAKNHPIEEVGTKLRGMMPWIKENKIVDNE